MLKKWVVTGLALIACVVFGGCALFGSSTAENVAAAQTAFASGQVQRAQTLCAKLSQNGNAWGQRCMGELAQGTFDFKQAAKWYGKAARQGDPIAQYKLGILYNNRLGVALDFDKSAALWRKAAQQGNADAQFALGRSYVRGEGVEKDFKQAAVWLRKAARQGQTKAQYYLCLADKNGYGVQQSYKAAAKWCRKAAEHGHAGAQYELAGLHAHGQGVPENLALAVAWWEKAADQMHIRALNDLGLAYEKGRAVPKDLVMAYALFAYAEALKPKDSVPAMNRVRLNKSITSAQRQQALQLKSRMLKSDHWQSVYQQRKQQLIEQR